MKISEPKQIPVPGLRTRQRNQELYAALRALEPGTMIELSASENESFAALRQGVSNALAFLRQQTGGQKKFAYRTLGERTIGIWRIT